MLMDVIVPALVAGFAILVIIGHVDLIKAAAQSIKLSRKSGSGTPVTNPD
ncbi:MAG: hypothetical protein ACJ8D7_20510 [Xanthobacteraceae bacterium]